jgi:hypothetical protein
MTPAGLRKSARATTRGSEIRIGNSSAISKLTFMHMSPTGAFSFGARIL